MILQLSPKTKRVSECATSKEAPTAFKNLTIQGKAITSQTDSGASWNIANGVTNITFE